MFLSIKNNAIKIIIKHRIICANYKSLVIIVIYFGALCNIVNAQVDSLKTEILNNYQDKNEVANNYNKLSNLFLDIDIPTSRAYADSALYHGKQILDLKAISDAYVNYANSYYFQGNLDSALFYFEKSYHQIAISGDKNEIAASLNRLGLIHETQSNYGKAADYYYKSLFIYEETGNLNGVANIYNNLGVLNDALGLYSESLLNYKKALKLFEKTDNVDGQANVYNNIATHFAEKNQLEDAITYINNAITILVKSNRKLDAAAAYYNASILYEQIGSHDTARLYLDSALINYLYTENKHGIANVYGQQAKLFQNNENYFSAINLMHKSLDLRREVGNLNAEAQTIKQLSDVYFLNNNYEMAYLYYRDYNILKDSIFDLNTRKTISELKIMYETEKKDKEISILKKESEIKKIQNNFLIFISIAFAIVSFLLFYFFKIKSRLLNSQKKYYAQKEKINKLERAKQETERILLEQEIKNQQEINELQKNKFESELEHSKRELATSTFQILDKNKILADIKESISTLKPSNIEEKIIFKRIIKKISTNINLDSDWQQFKIHFEKVNTGFFEKLQNQYPELSQGDLRVCAYIRINLSSKEIAQMMNISSSGINKRLYRIRKKMNLPPHTNINNHISTL